MMKPILTAAVVALVASTWGSPAGAQTPGVSLVIKEGRVTLKAEQASVRQILAEWERQGQVHIVGADKLAGAPITISLTDMPERQALEIVMRGVPGYMAVDRAPAATVAASTSRFDRLIVMARAATPVPAASMASSRPMPSPAQPMMPGGFVPPTAPDDDTATAQPERNDVEQMTGAEPPMPEAPVASPYPNAYPGSPYVGANGAANQQVGPYGGNPTAAAAAAGVAPGTQPELQFDYANPQKYFEQRRLQQEAAGAQPTAFPTAGTGPNGANRGTPTPSAMPTAPGTLARPGIAPTPTTPQTTQGEFFNPYNLPADWVPPPPVQTDPTTPPVEPDRAKYANPYEQPKPPEE